ncbi:baseplate J/gp47 family protein [Pseudomonas putida]|uniref:baseplate J/gp47 family protein n=1 Tax=Pseudomonas putida TaxID=303 RepID=UPI001C212548|nr:baseplate J/gp47 family protein [Pseudomonas putida]
MAFSSPGFESILTGILRDIRSLQAEADVGTDSDHYVRSAAVAAAIEGIYQKLSWLYRQIFADTADDEELIHTAAIRGVTLKPAVSSSAPVELTGSPGAMLNQGATMTHLGSGEVFIALSSAEVADDDKAEVLVQAETPGVSLNGLSGALVLTSPPIGMDAAAKFVEETSGGADEESITSLLARYLDIVRKPPAGGAEYDYTRWAKEVPGVSNVLVLPRRRGGGTVDVVITGQDGVPSEATRVAVLENIERQCSVIADVWVVVPVERVIDCHALVELEPGYTLSEVQATADDAYASLLGTLGPTETLKKSQIEAMVSNLAGVLDRAVVSPASNVKASEDPLLIGWIRPGPIVLELMA